MTQLNLVYGGDFRFSLKSNGKEIASICYEYQGEEDEKDHLKTVVSKFKKFRKQFVNWDNPNEDKPITVQELFNSKKSLISWDNGNNADLSISINWESEIVIICDCYEQGGGTLVIPIVNKAVILADIDNIIKSLKNQIKGDNKLKIDNKLSYCSTSDGFLNKIVTLKQYREYLNWVRANPESPIAKKPRSIGFYEFVNSIKPINPVANKKPDNLALITAMENELNNVQDDDSSTDTEILEFQLAELLKSKTNGSN